MYQCNDDIKGFADHLAEKKQFFLCYEIETSKTFRMKYQ